ncbi:hypothetical protein [Thalassospira australica]|uniref:hypothetical protein n=1 Tax=Thalassospira australica TaxID=1528106 RepID=UPI00384F82F8
MTEAKGILHIIRGRIYELAENAASMFRKSVLPIYGSTPNGQPVNIESCIAIEFSVTAKPNGDRGADRFDFALGKLSESDVQAVSGLVSAKGYALKKARVPIFGCEAVAKAAQDLVEAYNAPKEEYDAIVQQLINRMRKDLTGINSK